MYTAPRVLPSGAGRVARKERRLTTSERTSSDRGTHDRGRVLAVYGHPDDEGQATSTLAAFVAAGWGATLVCATRGEVGEISDPAVATPETLGYTRELELRAAMTQIGLADVRFLPFRDSGMAGTPANEDLRCLHQQPPEAVTERLVEVMRSVRPRIVLTWDPDGGYGHPDHVAAHRATVAAFDACTDPAAYPSAGEAWQPERLFWGAFGRRRFGELFRAAEEAGGARQRRAGRLRVRGREAQRAHDAPHAVRRRWRLHAHPGGPARPLRLRGALYQARAPLPADAPREAGFPELR